VASTDRRVLLCRLCGYRLDVHRSVVEAFCTTHEESILMAPVGSRVGQPGKL
jgi:hypothetical protein